MKKLSLLFAALLTATVMNLQAEDPASVEKTSFASGDQTGFALNDNISAEVWGSGVRIQTGNLAFTQSGSLIFRAQNGCKMVGFSVTYTGSGDVKRGDQSVVSGTDYPLNNVESFTLNMTVTDIRNSPQRMATNARAAMMLSAVKIFYIPDFLYFVGLNGNDTVRLNKYAKSEKELAKLTATFEYSKDRINWKAYDTWGTYGDPVDRKALGAAIELAKGDTVFFRAKGTNGKNATMSNSGLIHFIFAFGADDQIAAGGNTMSLYDATCEQDTMTDFGFINLFQGAKQLVSAPKLPATKLAQKCYQNMFTGCTSLTAAPELKATTLADRCYFGMFSRCTSLQVDTCADGSCDGVVFEPTTTGDEPTGWNNGMFDGCKGTITIPQLGGHYCIKEYVEQTPVAYIDANGQEQSCTEYTIVEDADAQVIWNAGWYVVNGTVTLEAGAACDGAVNLILTDGAYLTATGGDNAGIEVSGMGNTLTIYGQSELTGKLYASSDIENSCGIGYRDGGGDAESIVVAADWTVTADGAEVAHTTTQNIAMDIAGFQVVKINMQEGPTSIQSVRGKNADQPVKFIENGQLIIIKNGVRCNVLGQVAND